MRIKEVLKIWVDIKGKQWEEDKKWVTIKMIK